MHEQTSSKHSEFYVKYFSHSSIGRLFYFQVYFLVINEKSSDKIFYYTQNSTADRVLHKYGQCKDANARS